MNKKDFLTKFKPKTKVIKVNALDGEEVEIRELTVSESNEVQTLMLKDSSTEELATGKINVSVGQLAVAQTRAVSLALVSPRLTEEELSGLGSDARAVIIEIYETLMEFNSQKSRRA